MRERIGARRVRRAYLRHQIKLTEGQPEKQQRQRKEDWPVWFHRRQTADPGAANAEAQQHERADTACRRADCGQYARDQRASSGNVHYASLLEFRSVTINTVLEYGVKGNLMAAELSIGKLAEAAGVNIETIRYYQRRGLLEEPAKPPGGHRRYSAKQAERLRFIKRAQALGFTLTEVDGLLTLDGAAACQETRALAAQKLVLIEQKLADLADMRQALDALIRQCLANGSSATCPIIDVLTRD